MTDTSTEIPQEPVIDQQVTVELLNSKMDMLGEQMNWLCDNLAGLFGFVSQMQNNGGGIMGLRKAMKEMPDLGMGNGEQQQ